MPSKDVLGVNLEDASALREGVPVDRQGSYCTPADLLLQGLALVERGHTDLYDRLVLGNQGRDTPAPGLPPRCCSLKGTGSSWPGSLLPFSRWSRGVRQMTRLAGKLGHRVTYLSRVLALLPDIADFDQADSILLQDASEQLLPVGAGQVDP